MHINRSETKVLARANNPVFAMQYMSGGSLELSLHKIESSIGHCENILLLPYISFRHNQTCYVQHVYARVI